MKAAFRRTRWNASTLRSPRAWGGILSETMDGVTLLALLLTDEIASWPFLAALALIAVRFLFRFRLGGAWLVPAFLALGAFGVWLSLRTRMPPVVSAAHVLPIGLTLLPFLRTENGAWGWRLALGFMGILLSSTLSPEFGVTLLALFFIACTTLALRCRHLDSEFSRRAIADGALPRGFIRTGFAQSGILLLSALLIFPLIPRMQGRTTVGGLNSDPATTGYSEEVNLSEWARLGSGGGGATVLRIYAPDGADPSQLIPAGLLRSRVLGELTPSRWEPSPIQIDSTPIPKGSKEIVTLDFSLETLTTPSLPVPYGTRDVLVETQRFAWRASRTQRSEWRETRSRNQRMNYRVEVDLGKNLRPMDLPTPSDLHVPSAYRTSAIEALAKEVVHEAKSPIAKIRSIQDYFRKEGFQAAYSDEVESRATSEEEKALPPIERFLFVEKQGHCELFASSFAILLRLNGIPSRLVAGFRFSRNAFGDVLIVRQSDAHAWVEAYLPDEGWTVIDPTPRILSTIGFQDWIRDGYDWFNAKWVRYIVNFGEDEVPLAESARSVGGFAREVLRGNTEGLNASETELYLFTALFLLFSASSAWGAVLIFRRWSRARPSKKTKLTAFTRKLIRERDRFERKIAGSISKENAAIAKAAENWEREYEVLRFGPPLSEDIREERLGKLREIRKSIY